nr:MAG TPA: hypothetical protein [Caudoviricetes sp.]
MSKAYSYCCTNGLRLSPGAVTLEKRRSRK